jgi:RNA polymerase sigma factor (sigma-70 family)
MVRGPQAEPGFAAAQQSGRTAAFEAAVLSHLGAAYTLARYLTRRGDSAEDIVQEALLRAYRSFEEQRVENLRAWLLTIVRNCFLTWKARNSGGLDFEAAREQILEGQEGGHELDTPETILIQQEESGAIRAVIECLPQLFREVLVLRDIEDMSYREIAEITEVPIGTVMSRLARARKMFAAAWNGSERNASKEMAP